MAEAILRRDESIPYLLDAMAWADEHPDEANDADPPYMLHLVGLFVLAQLREPRAYPLAIRIFRNPQWEELTGEAIADVGHRLLGSVCDGNTGPIEALIEDLEVDQYLRGAALDAWAVLLLNGVKSREEVSAYFGELFAGRLDRTAMVVWSNLVALCTDFGMSEHLEAIRGAYRENVLDPDFVSLEEVENDIVIRDDKSRGLDPEFYQFITDAAAEMEIWFSYDPDEDPVFDQPWLGNESDFPGEPVVRTTPKIGRNDLCPCGSGKKYKKCCGNAAQG